MIFGKRKGKEEKNGKEEKKEWWEEDISMLPLVDLLAHLETKNPSSDKSLEERVKERLKRLDEVRRRFAHERRMEKIEKEVEGENKKE